MKVETKLKFYIDTDLNFIRHKLKIYAETNLSQNNSQTSNLPYCHKEISVIQALQFVNFILKLAIRKLSSRGSNGVAGKSGGLSLSIYQLALGSLCLLYTRYDF